MRCCKFRLFGLTATVLFSLTASADVLTFSLSATPAAKGDTSTGVYNPLAIYKEPGGFGVAFSSVNPFMMPSRTKTPILTGMLLFAAAVTTGSVFGRGTIFVGRFFAP